MSFPMQPWHRAIGCGDGPSLPDGRTDFSVARPHIEIYCQAMAEPMSSVDQFLSYTNVLSDLVMVIVVADVIALFVMFLLEKYDPRVFLTWLILMVLLPPVGFILYMYMGSTIYNRRKFMPKNITDTQLMKAVEHQAGMLERDLSGNPAMSEEYAMAKLMDRAGAWSYTRGNDMALYTEGNDKITALMQDIRSAEKSILIEYYIIRNDRVGNIFMDILIGKVKEGVEVRLLTDGFGIGKGPKEGIFRFINAGGHYAMFHSSINLMLSPKKNNRNHRKIAVIDGKVGYCGGFNIGDEYLGEGPLGHWRDATVRVEGPGVIPMMVRFCADWQYSSRRDPMKPLDRYIGKDLPVDGDASMQLVSGGPDSMPNNPVQMQYLAMMSRAKRRLYITTPYLVPDESMLTAMGNAVRRGVDVRILVPDKKDHMFVYWNNMTYSKLLIDQGVRVWRYRDGFVHEKMVLMDDDICSVGSANMDHRSLTLNFETNVLAYSREITEQCADRFLKDLESSTEYTDEMYGSRTMMMRIRMAVSKQLILLA